MRESSEAKDRFKWKQTEALIHEMGSTIPRPLDGMPPLHLGVHLDGRSTVKCPSCHHPESRVVDSREAMENTAIRRRRECEACGMRFTTYERMVAIGLLVRKRDGRIEPFQRGKLAGGIAKACEKRPIPPERIEAVVDDIEDLLKSRPGAEVTSEEIGELACQRLRGLDDVAYLRFASVYKEFADASHFQQELQTLKQIRG